MTDKIIFTDKARRAIDALLPAHTHRGTSRPTDRFWTTIGGVFRLDLDAGDHFSKRFVFHNEADGWQIQVPMTAAGLDALAVAMVLAGAIEVPPTEADELFSHGVDAVKRASVTPHRRYS